MFLFTNLEPRLFETLLLCEINPAENWQVVVKFL